MAKLKKKSSERFFAKSQKPRNDVKFASDVNIFGKNWLKTAKIEFLRVKKWLYVIDIIFWHVLAKLKKKSSERFFLQNPKKQNNVKYGFFCYL